MAYSSVEIVFSTFSMLPDSNDVEKSYVFLNFNSSIGC